VREAAGAGRAEATSARTGGSRSHALDARPTRGDRAVGDAAADPPEEWCTGAEERRALLVRLAGIDPQGVALVPATSYGPLIDSGHFTWEDAADWCAEIVRGGDARA
jgi:hypothetical protein